jgi:hypothetical protein
LAFTVQFEAANVDSARVVCWSPVDSVTTPFFSPKTQISEINVLGLLTGARYDFVVEGVGPAGTVTSPVLRFDSGDLPGPLQDVRFEVAGHPSGGFNLLSVFLDSVAYAVAFDGLGIIRWYRAFPGGVRATETKQQVNGNITVFLGSTDGFQPVPGRYVEVAPDGQEVGAYSAPDPLYTDNHELLLTFDDVGTPTAHLFSYDVRQTDLSAIGGSPDVLLAGHQILRLTPGREIQYSWDAWDHFSVEDAIELPPQVWQLSNIDFDHPNSLEFDLDGHYVASWRHLGEVTKIDSQTGQIIWRMGGRNNQFTFPNDAFGGFSAQHSVRVLENGNVLLYDNGLRHDPPESRAVEYQVDTEMMTATMVWEYRHHPAIFTAVVGSVQRLEDGNTLVGFGQAGIAVEVAPDNSAVWDVNLQIESTPSLFYRVTRIKSLYGYERP